MAGHPTPSLETQLRLAVEAARRETRALDGHLAACAECRLANGPLLKAPARFCPAGDGFLAAIARARTAANNASVQLMKVTGPPARTDYLKSAYGSGRRRPDHARREPWKTNPRHLPGFRSEPGGWG